MTGLARVPLEDRLRYFLRQNLALATPDGDASRVDVHAQTRDGRPGSLVGSWAVTEADRDDPKRQDSLAEVIRESIGSWTLAGHGEQLYTVAIYYGTAIAPARVHPIRSSPPSSLEEPLVLEPSPRGLVEQLMRHLEVQARVTAGATHRTMEMLFSDLAAAREQIAELHRERDQIAAQVREIERMGDEAKAAKKAAKQAAKRDEYVRQKIDLLIPIVMRRLLGTSAASSADSEAIRALVASLDDRQTETILSALRPEQAAGLWDLIRAARTRQSKDDDEQQH